MNLHFRPATEQDDDALRRLFREVEMEGDIAVSFEREPSFFRAVQPQGSHREVFLCEDLDTGIIAGVGSRVTADGYLNGTVQPIAYLSDLRVRREYRNGTGLVRAYRYLGEIAQRDPRPLTYTVIFENNEKALSSIAGGRAGLPNYIDQGRWMCPALWFGKRRNDRIPGIEVRNGSGNDLPRLVQFLNEMNQDRALAPFHRSQ